MPAEADAASAAVQGFEAEDEAGVGEGELPEDDGVDPPHAAASAARQTGARPRAKGRFPTQVAVYAGRSA
jgi:hypothetical protein